MNLSAVKALLEKALDNPQIDLRQLSESEPGSSPEVLAEVERLRAAHSRMPPILCADTLAGALGMSAGDAADDDVPAVGTLIASRYLLEALLAATPQSVVYRARDQRMADAPVVVKVLRDQGAGVEALREVLRNEIQALARLRHPGVAGLVDEGICEPGLVYAVMQYIVGDSLRTLLQRGKLKPDVAESILAQTADIIDAAHQVGIVHCDLKPENIMVDVRPGGAVHVSVVDFGIAVTKRAPAVTAVSALRNPMTGRAGVAPFRGTPTYAAPEQILGTPGAASDIYALAKVAQELFPHASGNLLQVLEQGIADLPERRPSTAGAFAGAIRRARELRVRRRRLTLALATLFLVAAIFTAREYWRPGNHVPEDLRRLTSLKGVELDAAFSADGKQLYYSQGPGQEENRKLFAFHIQDENQAAREITDGPGTDGRPALSQDGRWLAYLHREGSLPTELRLTGPEGGPFRILHRGDIQSISFGPFSDLLFFTEWLHPQDLGVIRRLDIRSGVIDTYPPPPDYRGDIDVSISPDGKWMAFARYRLLESGDLYVCALDAAGRPVAEPQRVTQLDRRVFRPAWYPDSKQLLFTAGSLTNTRLHKLDLRQSSPLSTELTGYGDHVQQAAVSPVGTSMVIVRSLEDSDIWQFFLSADGAAEPQRRPRRVFSSTSLDEEARFAPDGTSIAFFSERVNGLQAWLASDVMAAPRLLSQFHRAEKAWVSWSPTGTLSVFCRLPSFGPALFQMTPESGSSLQLVFSASSKDRVVGISRDGQALYVTPEDRTSLRLERWHIRSGARELIARVEAGFLKESTDGQWLYYARRHEADGLFRMPRNGGEESRVAFPLSRRNTFDVHSEWAYYVSPEPETGLYRTNLLDGRRQLLCALDRIPGWGLDISPDGRSLLLPLYDFDDADIFLASRLP